MVFGRTDRKPERRHGTLRGSCSEPQQLPRTDTFTGEVRGESRLRLDAGIGVTEVLVSLGARTYWHSHRDGEVLQITAGRGCVGTREGSVVAVLSGDTVWAPPGEVHYHGATADSFLLHQAVSLDTTTWLEEVSDDDYGH